MTERIVRCKYHDCTAEATSTGPGDIRICQHHLARVIELLADRGFTVLLPESSRPLATASKES